MQYQIEQENAAKAAFESKRTQIQFYKPSAMKEQNEARKKPSAQWILCRFPESSS